MPGSRIVCSFKGVIKLMHAGFDHVSGISVFVSRHAL